MPQMVPFTRPGWRALACAWAVRFGDRGKQQIEIARDIRHGADGGARIAPGRLLLD